MPERARAGLLRPAPIGAHAATHAMHVRPALPARPAAALPPAPKRRRRRRRRRRAPLPTDIALVCLHLRNWRLLAAARHRRAAKLAALGLAADGSDAALLAEPLIPRDAPTSCRGAAVAAA